jgi:hypothetical protein
MPGRVNHLDQLDAITKVTEVASQALAFKEHVRQIVGSAAFRGSRRSQEFLQFLVDRALEGHFEDLKERALGVQLFGRSPSYDTGDDSIVRVTARDVRKRLNHYYAEFGAQSDLRVELAPGSYIPEFRIVSAVRSPCSESGGVCQIEEATLPPATSVAWKSVLRSRIAVLLGFLTIALALQLWSKYHSAAISSGDGQVFLWSALSQPNRPIRLVFCDPDIVNIQRLLNFSVSLSDYANQHYWPDPASLKPDLLKQLQAAAPKGANVAAVDARVALKIANAGRSVKNFSLDTYTARSLRFTDFKTDDNFVLLGSPRSNPWVELYQDQLDFSFEFDTVQKAEFVRNKHPRSGERSIYSPTTQGWGTGEAYAVVALVSNPDRPGQILLIAGSAAEATEAAGDLAANAVLLQRTLKNSGIDVQAPLRHFEILLRVSIMAGSPNTFEVIACHALPGRGA